MALGKEKLRGVNDSMIRGECLLWTILENIRIQNNACSFEVCAFLAYVNGYSAHTSFIIGNLRTVVLPYPIVTSQGD